MAALAAERSFLAGPSPHRFLITFRIDGNGDTAMRARPRTPSATDGSITLVFCVLPLPGDATIPRSGEE
jgi:hypothetical protein